MISPDPPLPQGDSEEPQSDNPKPFEPWQDISSRIRSKTPPDKGDDREHREVWGDESDTNGEDTVAPDAEALKLNWRDQIGGADES